MKYLKIDKICIIFSFSFKLIKLKGVKIKTL